MVVEPIDPFQGCVLNDIDVTAWNAPSDDLGLKQPDDYPDQGVVVLTFPSMTETDPMLNPVAGVSERAEGKSKKGEGFRKPNSERLPNRNHNRRLFDVRDAWLHTLRSFRGSLIQRRTVCAYC